MFDWPLDWFALLAALAALLFARRTSVRLTELQARLDKIEAVRLAPAAPPLSPNQEPTAAPVPPPLPDVAEPVLQPAALTAVEADQPPPLLSQPLPQPAAGFEERIGTR